MRPRGPRPGAAPGAVPSALGRRVAPGPVLAGLLAALVPSGAGPAWADDPVLRSDPVLPSDPVLARVSDAVVRIEATRARIHPRLAGLLMRSGVARPHLGRPTAAHTGTGVVRSAGPGDKVVWTSGHVVAGAVEVTVVDRAGEAHPAEVLGRSVRDDLAVLGLSGGGDRLAPWAREAADAGVGTPVWSIGYADGGTRLVSDGVVSGRQRRRLPGGAVASWWVTDALVRRGMSGGPLLRRTDGALVGLLAAGFDRTSDAAGFGLALPVEQAAAAAQRMLVAARSPGRLGVGAVTAPQPDPDGADGATVVLSWVEEDSPAAAAGLQVDDRLVAVEGVALDGVAAWAERVAAAGAGASLTLTLRRGSGERSVPVTLAPAPPSTEERSPSASLVLQPVDGAEGSDRDIHRVVACGPGARALGWAPGQRVRADAPGGVAARTDGLWQVWPRGAEGR